VPVPVVVPDGSGAVSGSVVAAGGVAGSVVVVVVSVDGATVEFDGSVVVVSAGAVVVVSVDGVVVVVVVVSVDGVVVVVDDGSSDETIERLRAEFELEPVRIALRESVPYEQVLETMVSRRDPRLVVIGKENGGKADALNTGMCAASYPFICSVDADTLIEEEALLRVAMPIIEDPDRVVATGGIVRMWALDAFQPSGAVVEELVSPTARVQDSGQPTGGAVAERDTIAEPVHDTGQRAFRANAGKAIGQAILVGQAVLALRPAEGQLLFAIEVRLPVVEWRQGDVAAIGRA